MQPKTRTHNKRTYKLETIRVPGPPRADGSFDVVSERIWVRPADTPVDLTVGAAHALSSARNHGRGRSDVCAGAVCALEQADRFPHHVTGYVQYFRTRAFVQEEMGKNGKPGYWVRYTHGGRVDEDNDVLGPERLAERLLKAGPEVVRLDIPRPDLRKGRHDPRPNHAPDLTKPPRRYLGRGIQRRQDAATFAL